MAAITTITNRNGTVEAHAAGCKDIKSKMDRHADSFTEETASQLDAFLSYNQDFIAEGGMENGHDIRFLPCCKLPKTDPSAEAFKASLLGEDAEVEETPAANAKLLSRKECLAELAAASYTGPTSYLVPVLRELVATHAN